ATALDRLWPADTVLFLEDDPGRPQHHAGTRRGRRLVPEIRLDDHDPCADRRRLAPLERKSGADADGGQADEDEQKGSDEPGTRRDRHGARVPTLVKRPMSRPTFTATA